MNRRSVTGFEFVSRLLARMNSEVPAWLILAFIAAYVTVAALAAYRSPETRRLARMDRDESGDNASRSNSNDLLRILPGVVQPLVVDPLNVPWKNEDEVVGVTVNGQSRAYLVEALSRPDYHIINDLIGLVPVSITYCNINRCAPAFTQEGAKRRLDIAIGGQHNLRELLLFVDGARFHQDNLKPYEPGHGSASFPYQHLPLTVTTWGKWKTLHPDTRASMPRQGPSRQRPRTHGVPPCPHGKAATQPRPECSGVSSPAAPRSQCDAIHGASQILTVRSKLAVAISLPSGENAIQRMLLSWSL